MGTILKVFAILTMAVGTSAFASSKAIDCDAYLDTGIGDPQKLDRRCFVVESVETTPVAVDERNILPDPRPSFTPPSDPPPINPVPGPTPTATPTPAPLPIPLPGGGLNALLDTADHIIAIGTKIWNFIKDNGATVNSTEATASVLPAAATSWDLLDSWGRPQSRQYRTVFKNGFNRVVADFTYRVQYTSGGRIDARVGHYLANVQVAPVTWHVVWGFKFTFTAVARNPINIGTRADPVAGIELAAAWQLNDSLGIATNSDSATYFITGQGDFDVVGGHR